MREIKFRAWNIPNKLMFENVQDGFLAENEIGELIIGVSLGKLSKDAGSVLMQYTGLKDKTGREIYEGDIIEHKGWSKKKGRIVWDNDFLAYVIRIQDGYYQQLGEEDSDVKIIGNIYENPELLKEQD